MKIPRRTFLHLAASGFAVAPLLPRAAHAQACPARPVQIIVDLPAGLAPDVAARLIAAPLGARLGQSVVVEDRPGAGGNVGAEVVVRAAPDGYTLLLEISGNAVNATLYPNLTFDFLRDITPVAFIGITPFVLTVHPSFPAKSVPEFIAYAKAHRGQINVATAGSRDSIASLRQVVQDDDRPQSRAGAVQVELHARPACRAGAGRLHHRRAHDRLSAQRQAARARRHQRDTRMSAIPDIPPIGDFVKGYEGSGWLGVGAPRNTPAAIVDKLNKEINAIIVDPKMKDHLVGLGIEPQPMSPAQFGKLCADATEKWAKVIKFAGIKLQ